MKKMTSIIWAIVVLLIAGCGQIKKAPMIPATTPTTTVTTTSTAKDISIVNFQFSPATMDITMGETIKRTNNDVTTHTIVADDNSFQSDPIQPGGTFSFTFDHTGTYTYHCSIHPSMKGTITVK